MWPDNPPTYTGTYGGTSNSFHYHGLHTKNPISWKPTNPPVQSLALVTLQMDTGELKIYPNGSVEYPGTMDQAAEQFWDYVQAVGRRCFGNAVRAEAARVVREVVPTLVDLDDYQRATLPLAVAAAVSLP